MSAFVVWLTGLPASGKSELAAELQQRLIELGCATELIDSGKLRKTPLGQTLGFSKHDRETNVLRHGITARLLTDNGVNAIVSAVSPYRSVRNAIREQISPFIEVYVSTPPEVCQQRDQNGHWQRAIAGEIEHFTGVSDPYEAPLSPEVTVDLTSTTITEAIEHVLIALEPLLIEVVTPSESTDIANKLAQLGYSDN